MTRHHRRWRALAAISIIGFVSSWPAYVDAHAVFVNTPASISADTDVALSMSVPHERDDTTYNVDVAIQLPDGWTGVACATKATWTCTMANESGHVVIQYVKDAGAAPAEDETFQYTAHAGSVLGTVEFPTLQTYNTGEVVAWIGAPGGGDPAPTLEVTAAPPTTPPATPAPTNPPETDPPVIPAPTVAPTPTTAVATTIPTSASSSSPSTTATTSSTTTTADTTTTAVSTTEPTSTTTLTTVTQPSDSDSEGGNAGVVVAIVVALLAAAGAGTYLYLRRRRATNPAVD
jgi:Domain of unkown function (DUF1775)